MQTRKLRSLDVSSIGLGCMGMTPIYGNPDPALAIETIHRALDLGINLIDTSDAYGKGANEQLVGRAIAGQRDRYVISTKFGNLRLPDGSPGVNGRPEYVQQACEASLKRLGIDVIDLYFQHRVDPSVPIEDTVGAMGRLVEQGKVRHIGLSEAAPARIRRAQATFPITALQTEYSLATREVETEILDLCKDLGIGFVAYGALGRGLLTGRIANDTVLDQDDIRLQMPRFQGANREHQLCPGRPPAGAGASRTLHAVATRHRLAAWPRQHDRADRGHEQAAAPGRECGGRFAAAGAINVAGAGRHFSGRRRRGRAHGARAAAAARPLSRRAIPAAARSGAGDRSRTHSAFSFIASMPSS